VPDVREVREGDDERIGLLRVTATGALHDARRYPHGPSAQPIGFVVTGSQAVYFAGDTDIFAGMRDLNGTLDLALLPVWGWGSTLGPGHLDPARAAEAAALIEPRVAIPIHWGTFALPRPFRGNAASDRPAHEFQAQVKRRSPRVEVRLLRPGERTVVA
jgi:L-ascorbate metabolism protein UlaG (beta-lactamase superfamily)